MSPRIVFMGTPEFAVEPLKAIKSAGYNIVAVITAPDKPFGRGLRMHSSPVKQFAEQAQIPVLQPFKLRDPAFQAQLAALNPDLGVVVAFRMLPQSVWSLPRLGTFNLHASLLPNYRGAAPINWAIINGETTTGVTTFMLKHEIDTGDIMLQQKVDIAPTDTAGSLHNKLMHAGAPLVVKSINMIINGKAKFTAQNSLCTSTADLKPAPKIFKDTCQINWEQPASVVHNLIRGLSPYPCATAKMRVKRLGQTDEIALKIYRSTLQNTTTDTKPGTISSDSKTYLKVACGKGSISINELQQAGKRPMPIDEFMNGWQNTEFETMVNP